MNSLLIVGIAVAGLGFILVAFKMLKKGSALAAKFPTNFLVFFLIFALIGLSGFSLKNQTSESPMLIGLLLLLVALTGGVIITDKLYKWEWSAGVSFGRKLLYLSGIMLTSMVAFGLIFVVTEHRWWPRGSLSSDLVWWFAALITIMLVPLLIKLLHEMWNEIPMVSQLKHYFELPIGTSPPFIEAGGTTVNFQFVIPLDYRSREVVQSKIAMPLNKTLEEAFHYKVHEHNIVKRFAKKIVLAEENKRAKIYGWYFYRNKKIWWGLWSKKHYLDPKMKVGANIFNGETIFTERVRIWDL
ncbi:MAG: TssN family type VI secretion system protein [Saprospiraceae bacterium]|nr:hypothetical protein [Lewinella sp.]